MRKARAKRLPRLRSLESLVAFFDTHDMGDYWDQMPEAHFDVDIKRVRHLFSLDARLAEGLTRIARSKGTSSQRLINRWLREKIVAESHPAG